MNKYILATSQLGIQPNSPKKITLVFDGNENELPDKIPFYIQKSGSRLKRDYTPPPQWKGRYFRWPYQLGKGQVSEGEQNHLSEVENYLYKGYLNKKDTDWGIFWQGDFSGFKEEGVFQIETDYQASVPFMIDKSIYNQMIRSYLNFIFNQRSGFEIPGLREATHLDDAVLDVNGEQVDVSGGWYDAGDYRKWLSLTLGNLETLDAISHCGIKAFENRALDELAWGNKYYFNMVSPEGQVWEDVGGGDIKEGIDYDKDWWFENHPGCNCDGSGTYKTDNIPDSGDERTVRTTYNPQVQYQFTWLQALLAKNKKYNGASKSLEYATKTWQYGESHPHDGRTLYVSMELLAGLELTTIKPGIVEQSRLDFLVSELLGRQIKRDTGTWGYFTEKGQSDGYRSIVYACHPVQALLMVSSSGLFDQKTRDASAKAVSDYIDHYLLEDAGSNPFGVTPYGVYVDPSYISDQKFRPVEGNHYIRTFMAPINDQEIVHGGNSVLMHHALLMSMAANALGRKDWFTKAEGLLQWATGHNPDGLSLFTGIGHRFPVGYSAVMSKVPDAPVAGYIGTLEDTPYIEKSNWVEWSTQEIWDVPGYYAAHLALYLQNKSFIHSTIGS